MDRVLSFVGIQKLTNNISDYYDHENFYSRNLQPILNKTIWNTVDETNRPVMDQAIEKSDEIGIEVSPAELNDFRTFQTNISSHVQPTNMCVSPFMLLQKRLLLSANVTFYQNPRVNFYFEDQKYARRPA